MQPDANTRLEWFRRHRKTLLMVFIAAVLALSIALRVSRPAEAPPPPSDSGRVVYLGPASASARNLYLVDLASSQTRQLTDFPTGIDQDGPYAVRDDGQYIAFAAPATEDINLLDIWLVETDSGALTQLTNCAQAGASCYGPAWHPNGEVVGYTRQELAPDISAINRKRAWLVNIDSRETSLLFQNAQITGHTPRWGGQGQRVAVVTPQPSGILIYDYTTQETTAIDTQESLMGVFSPDGTLFVYPQLQQGAAGDLLYTQLQLMNFETGITFPISGGRQAPVEDIGVAFHPAGDTLAVVRRFLDGRYNSGGQLYQIDLETGQATELVADAEYSHGAPDWSPDGEQLVFQRFNYVTTGVEVMRYDLADGTTTQVAADGLLPQFVP